MKILTCKNCPNQYEVTDFYITRRKFCSKQCFIQNQRGEKHPTYVKDKTAICPSCNEVFNKKIKARKFCSNKCYHFSLKKKQLVRFFALDSFKMINEKKYMLPSEVQKTVFELNLNEKYKDKQFKKYSVKDYGIKKLKNQILFDLDFRESLLKRQIGTYSRLDKRDRWINSLEESSFVFYDEDEVLEWVLTTKSF